MNESEITIEPITSEEVSRLADIFDRHGLNAATLNLIRQVNPDRRITLCSEDDITVGRPVLKRETFHVFLVSGTSHCLTLTDDFDVAVGIVFAKLED